MSRCLDLTRMIFLAGGQDKYISLKFLHMDTECAYDYLFVYDGASSKDKLLGSFSGKVLPSDLTAKSGSMLIVFFSDTNYVLTGFKAEYKISDCPHNCSGHGQCQDHKCVCDEEWTGQLKEVFFYICRDNFSKFFKR
jgi:hypothetical protein